MACRAAQGPDGEIKPSCRSGDCDGDGQLASPIGDDCDDSDPLVPSEPVCGDAVDNDCDGIGECNRSGEVFDEDADVVLRGDQPGVVTKWPVPGD